MPDPVLLTSPSNPRIKEIAKLRQRSHRDRAGALLVEGYRELKRALDNAYRPRLLVTCEDAEGNLRPLMEL